MFTRGDNNFRCESDVAKAMEEALQLSRNIGQIYDKGDERDPTPPDPVAQLCEFVDQVMIVNFCIPSHLVTRKPTSGTTVDVKSKHGPGILIYTGPKGPPVDLPFDSEGRYVYPAYLIRGDKIHSQEVHFELLWSFLSPKTT